MTGKEDSYRAAAIRALCTITDPVMLQVSFLTLPLRTLYVTSGNYVSNEFLRKNNK